MGHNLNCRKRVKHAVKSADIYGYQMNLTYKHNQKFKTTLGGMFTLISKTLILIYLVFQVKDVINKRSEVRIANKYRDLNYDMTEYLFSEGRFDLAAYAQFTKTTHPNYTFITNNLDLYLTIQIRYVYSEWVQVEGKGAKQNTTFLDFPLELCSHDRFNGFQMAQVLGITGGFYCPVGFDSYSIQGAKYSPKMKFLQVNVDKCNQKILTSRNSTRVCKSQAEIEEVANTVTVQIAMLNQAFDSDSFDESPIKQKIMLETFQLETIVSQRQVYLLKRNEALLSDNPLTSVLGRQNLTYYETGLRSLTMNNPANGNPYLQFILGMNDNVQIVQRNAFTILDALSSVGGLFQVLVISIRFLIGNLQDQLFFQSIIKRIFLYDSNYLKRRNSSPKSKRFSNEIFGRNDESRESPMNSSKRKLKIGFADAMSEEKINPFEHTPENSSRESDKTLLQILVNIIETRKALNYTMKQYLGSKFKSLCFQCRLRKHKDTYQIDDLLYQDGVKKLKQEFDIVKLFRSMRKVELLTNIYLSGYQKSLLPYFKQNLLQYNLGDEQEKQQQTSLQKSLTSRFVPDIQDHLLQIIQKSKKSKVDKRIIKSLLDDDEQALSPRRKKRKSSPNSKSTRKSLHQDASFGTIAPVTQLKKPKKTKQKIYNPIQLK